MQSNKLGLQDNPQIYYYGCCIASCIYCTQRTFHVSRSKKIKPTSTVLKFIWGEREEYIRKRKRSNKDEKSGGISKRGPLRAAHLRGGISCQCKWQVRLKMGIRVYYSQ
uniref:Uncharacterized protein n=1 Tax=Micrurus spixii TaxID=129469 RepID=A0A2D4NCZ8_9SAUR